MNFPLLSVASRLGQPNTTQLQTRFETTLGGFSTEKQTKAEAIALARAVSIAIHACLNALINDSRIKNKY